MIDLRSLRPLDMATVLGSVAKTRRVVIVDEGWKSGSISAEIGMRLVEQAFFELDAPIRRVCSAEVPMPYAAHLEQAALPQRAIDCRGRAEPREADVSEFVMPSLGADMEAGTLVEWLKKPGEAVKRGDVVAVVETQKGAIEIEIFEAGVLDRILVQPGEKVPVGTPMATLRSNGAQEPEPAPPQPPPELPPQPGPLRRRGRPSGPTSPRPSGPHWKCRPRCRPRPPSRRSRFPSRSEWWRSGPHDPAARRRAAEPALARVASEARARMAQFRSPMSRRPPAAAR